MGSLLRVYESIYIRRAFRTKPNQLCTLAQAIVLITALCSYQTSESLSQSTMRDLGVRNTYFGQLFWTKETNNAKRRELYELI